MIPGTRNRDRLDADRPGRLPRPVLRVLRRSQHAHMAMSTWSREPPAAFRAWLADQARPAARAGTAAQARRGAAGLPRRAACADCHTIRGTRRERRRRPDLTHLASRPTLAALTIPNSPRTLRDWIRDPQHVKPGNQDARRSRLTARSCTRSSPTWRACADGGRPPPARAPRVERLERIWRSRPGLLGWLTTTDHKRIGLLYFCRRRSSSSRAGGVEALLMRTQLAEPNEHVVSPGHLRRAVVDARDHDDLPLHHPDDRRARSGTTSSR